MYNVVSLDSIFGLIIPGVCGSLYYVSCVTLILIKTNTHIVRVPSLSLQENVIFFFTLQLYILQTLLIVKGFFFLNFLLTPN